MLDKSFFERMVANRFIVCIKPQYPVAADAFFRDDKRIYRNVGLYRTGSTDTDDIQGTADRFYFFGFQIDMGQSIQFVDNDIDIIRTDTGGNHGKPVTPVTAGDGVKFAVTFFQLDLLKMGGDGFHPSRVTDQNDIVGKVLRK